MIRDVFPTELAAAAAAHNHAFVPQSRCDSEGVDGDFIGAKWPSSVLLLSAILVGNVSRWPLEAFVFAALVGNVRAGAGSTDTLPI